MATLTLHPEPREFQERVGEALDRSRSQPVLITRHGRQRNVVLSYDEYERLREGERRAVCATGSHRRRYRGDRGLRNGARI
ncbi:MAG: type II toxin-antitoxin system prevent-host-death family antitoxin [Alphaproteobacteria bacterium]|nr:type II toxin-antitoxin system prevent-host-death family antitoxin [Alphaproteobacteria bacterium]